jgi:N-acyl-L-homoserine lactone synthetase
MSTFMRIYVVYSVLMVIFMTTLIAISVKRGCATCTGVCSVMLVVQLAIIAWSYDRIQHRESVENHA